MATVRFYFFGLFFSLLPVDGIHSSLAAMRLRLFFFFFFFRLCSRVECECPCLPTLRIPTRMQWTNDGWRRGRRWNEYMTTIPNPQLWSLCYTNSAPRDDEDYFQALLLSQQASWPNCAGFPSLGGLDGKSCLALRLPL